MAPSNPTAAAKRKLASAAALVAKTAANENIRRRAALVAQKENEELVAMNEGMPELGVVSEDESDDEDDEDELHGHPTTSSDVEPGLDVKDFDEDDASGASGVAIVDVSVRTPVKRRRSRGDEGSNGRAAKKPYKVVAGEFTPTKRKLAEAAKKSLRKLTVLSTPYPGSTSRYGSVYAVVRETALTSHFANDDTRGAFQRLEAGPSVEKDHFITFVGYGRGNLMNAVIKKARGELGALGIPGNYPSKALQEKIAWLYRTESYKFGGLNLAEETYDRQQPFRAAFFGNLPRTMFLEGRGKADSEIFCDLLELQAVPKAMNSLFMTALEHALLEWREGTFKSADFKEDSGMRYMYHLAGWEKLEKEAPRYALKVQQDLFKQMLLQTNKLFLLESTVDAGAMNNLDFAGLESSVTV